MRCKDIERLIIDSSERDLSREEQLAIKQHTAHCAVCASFQDELEKIRISLKKMAAPVLPDALEHETRLMCYTELDSKRTLEIRRALKFRRASIPKLIWAALITLIVLTVILLVPSISEISLDQSMSLQDLLVLILILQNAVMLIFTPIVIRKFRSPEQSFGLF